MNTEYNDDQKAEEIACPVGEILKQARKEMGLSKQDVADRLKLRISVIRELEENGFDNKPITTFTRGYIRSYAKFLGLNADEILAHLKSAEQPIENEQQMQSFSRKTWRDKDDSRVMHLTWLILAIAVSITAFWWWQNLPSTSFQNTAEMEANKVSLIYTETFDDLGGESQRIEDESEMFVLPENQDEEINPDTETQVSANGKSKALETGSSNTDLSHRDASNKGSSNKKETSFSSNEPLKNEYKNTDLNALSSVLMSFSDDCWIEVHDATGKRLVTGVRFAGEELKLTGMAPFVVVLGASSAVSLTYDGEKIDLSGYPTGRVVRLSLPKSS